MPNKLMAEKSPYLLQHAENPVNWYPWSEEPFQLAQSEDKPVFLSVGYSTCHWCHVMARESFEDEEIAFILNESYISIKVDREERQDIDAVYMTVCQAMTGSGGWPLTILMTPDKIPFFAGTYLPKEGRYGATGLKELLLLCAELWKTQRQEITDAGNNIAKILSKEKTVSPSEPKKDLLLRGFGEFLRRFDTRWGGFGNEPKFPAAHNLLFLFEYARLENNARALEIASLTLDGMYRGGLFDHVGGGFCRYSTDEMWLIPHFEKTLYDNAMLSWCYSEAFRHTNDTLYRRIAERTLGYIESELRGDDGGFICGQDADSAGLEGKYYSFLPDELLTQLGEYDGAYFCEWYGIAKHGNFGQESIPNLLYNAKFREKNDVADKIGKTVYAYRQKRMVLGKDTKVLTSWNALTIIAFTKASAILGEPQYLHAAEETQKYLEEYHISPEGRLLVRRCGGETSFFGGLDDYAFYALALLTLYETTFNALYLTKATAVSEKLIALFSDTENGGFFLSASDAEKLLFRPKEVYDGALPSGNAAVGHVFVKLAALTGEQKWIQARDSQLGFLASVAADIPSAHAFSLSAMARVLYPATRLVCSSVENEVPKALIDLCRSKQEYNLTVLFLSPQNRGLLRDIVPEIKDYPPPKSGAVYYLCKNGTCLPPVTDLKRLNPSAY